MKGINAGICFFVTLVLFILSSTQYRGRGPVLNGSLFFSGRRGWKEADARRLYRRSGTVFLLLGAAFLCMGLWVLTDRSVFALLMGAAFLAALAYALVSAFRLSR